MLPENAGERGYLPCMQDFEDEQYADHLDMVADHDCAISERMILTEVGHLNEMILRFCGKAGNSGVYLYQHNGV